MKSTKYFWLFSPTQLLTQGQWWSIFRMQRLQTLWERPQVKCEETGVDSNIMNILPTIKTTTIMVQKDKIGSTTFSEEHKLTRVSIYSLTSSLHQNTAAGSAGLWEVHVLFVLPAVVCSIRLDAATLGTFVDHLPWFQLKAFYVFLCSIPFWHRPLARNMTTQ